MFHMIEIRRRKAGDALIDVPIATIYTFILPQFYIFGCNCLLCYLYAFPCCYNFSISIGVITTIFSSTLTRLVLAPSFLLTGLVFIFRL